MECEYGICEICGRTAALDRTYFCYDNLKCECHNNGHFEIVSHCDKCTPDLPKELKVKFKDRCNVVTEATITNIFPTKINGTFVIK